LLVGSVKSRRVLVRVITARLMDRREFSCAMKSGFFTPAARCYGVERRHVPNTASPPVYDIATGATMPIFYQAVGRHAGVCRESELYHHPLPPFESRGQLSYRALALAAALILPGCNLDAPTAPSTGGLEEKPETAAAAAPIAISPGQSIQAKVNSYPAGTQFLIKAGTHYGQRVVPKARNAFIGEPGAILDGRGTTPYAFERGSPPYPDYVHIKGLIIQNYDSPDQYGAILAGSKKTESTTGWIVENCEIRNNSHGGIKLGNKMKVLNNFIHHNKQIGISGSGDSVLVQGNEIAYNNYLKIFPFGKVLGGAKFIDTRWLVVRGNNVHHNEGNGLWTDIRNTYVLVENNVVTANSGAGIMHEISYDAIIRNNTARQNGFARTWITGAGILISASANVAVYGNTVTGNKQGIVGIQQNRTQQGIDYSSNLKNMNVHHNTIQVPAGGISGISSGVSNLTYTSRNNRYTSNTYDLGTDPKPFMWMNDRRTKTEWQTYGQDVNGTFH
jgi:parallel beta-helix repeat protein